MTTKIPELQEVTVMDPSDRTLADQRPSFRATTTSESRRKLGSGRRLRWLALLDVVAVAWMTVAGSWLDQHDPFSLVTLGGHSRIAAVLATASLLLLAGLAIRTEGFVRATSGDRVLLVGAGLLAAAALAGLFLIVVLVLLVASFVGLLVKLFLR